MHFRRTVFAITGLVTAFSLQAAAPSKNSGPSLQATMQFIQDKLTDSGTVSFVVVFLSPAGYSRQETRDVVMTDFRGDPQTCILSYRYRLGGVMRDHQLQLRGAQDVVVEPLKSAWTKQAALIGDPEAVSSVTPEMTALSVRLSHNKFAEEFDFVDADLADRVAKAIAHAIELCGGGSKDPF